MDDLEGQLLLDQMEALTRQRRFGRRQSNSNLRLVRTFESGNSSVWIVRQESGTARGVAVKRFLLSPGLRSHAEREFTVLRSLEELLASFPDLHVPHPLYFRADRELLVTQEVKGPRLDRFLTKRLRRFPLSRRAAGATEAASACSAIGRWLAAFRQFELLAPQDDALCDVAQSLRERYHAAEKRIPEVGTHLERPLPAIRDYFLDSIPLQAAATPAVPHHTDFSPYNVICGADGLYVLDVSEIGHGHPLEAVAFFWAYLETLRLSLLSSRERVARCQSAFLSAATDQGILATFWRRWGMFMRFSYLTRSQEQMG